ncbi:hypothetical protein EST38_g12876 [Candolleomyces aberdarensis]|uniref:Uncharacterized protein n=1 Tax=Candolleomyces aberdarensis TaxID=2316362 RepID=A0A4Q2D1C0_9AGAR|nr:hypothetical protein EST38_g12876 [Candolleomyces aberdarensis]
MPREQLVAAEAHSGTRLDTVLQVLGPKEEEFVQEAQHTAKQLQRIFKDTAGSELGQLLARHSHDSLHEDYRPVKVGLAPCYGTLGKDHKRMDDTLAVMVAQIVNILDQARARGEELDLDTVQSTFRQCASMVHCKDDSVENYRNFSEHKTKLFSNKGRSSEPIEVVCREIERWFNELIQDKNVLEFTTLKGLSGVKDIVARYGVSQEKRCTLNKVFLDIGVLRFPDMENPFVRVYRIRLSAWATCEKKFGFIEKNRNGIAGEYHSEGAKRNLEVFFSGEA